MLLSALLFSWLIIAGGAAAQPTQPPLDANTLKILLRTTIVALNHANRTGNYTVLRDLGSPSFRDANTSAMLAGIFAKLRARNLDLSPIVLFDPVFAVQPTYHQQGLLQMTGHFPTRPLHVVFNMSFRYLSNRWYLEAISIDTRPAAGAATDGPPEKKRQAPKKPANTR